MARLILLEVSRMVLEFTLLILIGTNNYILIGLILNLYG